MLNALTQKIQDGDFGDINSLVIVKNGKIVYEKYFNGAARNNLNLASAVTMNITSTLIGCAIDDGLLAGLDTRVMPMFEDYGLISDKTGWKVKITVGDILQMKSGIEWDELSLPLSNNNNYYNRLINSSDYFRFVLDQRMADEPGTVWNYNSGAAVLLARVIESSTGMNAEQYAKEKIFEPLGIKNYKWYKWFTGANGTPNTADGLRMRAIG